MKLFIDNGKEVAKLANQFESRSVEVWNRYQLECFTLALGKGMINEAMERTHGASVS